MEIFICRESTAATDSEQKRVYANLSAFKQYHSEGIARTIPNDSFNPHTDGELVFHDRLSDQAALDLLQNGANYCTMTFAGASGVQKTRFFRILRTEPTEDQNVIILTLERDNLANFTFCDNKSIDGYPLLTTANGYGLPVDFPTPPKLSNAPAKVYDVDITQTPSYSGYTLIMALQISKAADGAFPGLWVAGQTVYVGKMFADYKDAIATAGYIAGATEIALFGNNNAEEIHVKTNTVNMYIVPNLWVSTTNYAPFPIYGRTEGTFLQTNDIWVITKNAGGDDIHEAGFFFVNEKSQTGATRITIKDNGAQAGFPLMFGTVSTQVLLPPVGVNEIPSVSYRVLAEKSSGKMSFFAEITFRGNVQYMLDLTRDFAIRATYNAAAREQAQTETSRGIALLTSGLAVVAAAASQNYAGAAMGALGMAGTIAREQERREMSSFSVISGDGSAESTFTRTNGVPLRFWKGVDQSGTTAGNIARYGYKLAGTDSRNLTALLSQSCYIRANGVTVRGGTQEENDAARTAFERGVSITYVQ